MAKQTGYRTQPLGGLRRIVAASVAVGRERNTIHLVTEVDISEPRRRIARHRALTGDRISLTAYVVACLARVCAEHPTFNAFRKGRRLVILDDVVISVLIEREFDGEHVPEPIGIRAAHRKPLREINAELRAARSETGPHLGSANGMAWIRFVPGFLLRTVIRLASRNIGIQQRFGVIGVTSVGMFGTGAMWGLPLTSATVTVAVGSIVPRVVLNDGQVEEREHLCVTLSFDHDLIDGAPAARFARRFSELLSSGAALEESADAAPGLPERESAGDAHAPAPDGPAHPV